MITEIPPRYWGPNIVISGNGFLLSGQSQAERAFAVQRATAYQEEVQQVLRQIGQGSKTRTGEILLKAINNSTGGRTLRIVPFKENELNSITYASNWNRAYAAGEQYYYSGLQAAVKGKGGGTDAVITYEPRMFVSMNAYFSAVPYNNQYRQDDVLFHELVHALRMMRGLFLGRGVVAGAGQVGFKNVEEFYAILLADIYVSECGRGLESIRVVSSPDFHGIEQVKTFEKKDPRSYYEAYSSLIEKLAEQMGDVTRPIGDLYSIAWNPLRYHYNGTLPPVGSSMDKFDMLSGTGSTKVEGEFIPTNSKIFPNDWRPKP